MSKLLTVFGATGNQGGSVIRAVLADKALRSEFRIRGVTRDTSKPASKALEAKGVEMVKADMSSQQAAAPAVDGAHTVFLVTNFWETMDAAVELAQGKAVADASKAAGVQHIIFSSLINTTEASKGRLTHISHFDGKARIEDYIRGLTGVATTAVLPGFFMSNMLTMIRKGDDGAYAWTLPEGVTADKGQVPLFDASEDMGKFVKAAIKHYPSSAGKRIYAATDYYTPQRVVDEFASVLGVTARMQNAPQDVYKSFLPEAIAQEMMENMLLLEDPGYYAGASLKESLALLGDEKPTAWRDFVAQNKEKWL
ncbi:calcium-translocating P-type ATPase, PMCA-type [Purpureocillium lavendulum]|uniref:Calcium-translocating P-type ATPase, PMCA-type n=1 Tax=Purpureocillium lavendulum TaxID=1247861 RepID=A0AB34FEI8_9HYPO|nr:calcium-translocating P-type ATPase, PMCA-type [Purpureocillium lavendulum]